MNAQELLKAQFEQSHQFLEMTIADCTPEVLGHRPPRSTIFSIGGVYAHIAVSEDVMVNALGKGEETVISRDGWAAKLGIAEPGPFQTPSYADLMVDLPVLQEYAEAVGKTVDDFLSKATEAELARSVATPAGAMPALTFLANIASPHVSQHWGEIAALKGVQGLKGLPFWPRDNGPRGYDCVPTQQREDKVPDGIHVRTVRR